MPLPVRVLLLGLALAGCRYDYGNPAEGLGAGEVRGRAVAEHAGADEAAGGVTVTLKGGPALTQATRATGLFSVAPLPRGRHTLLLRKGATLAAEREVEIGFGGDGQLEGRALGTVKLLKTVSVSGRATLPLASGASVVSGVAVDEETGLTARLDDFTGEFTFPVLSAGPHHIKVFALGDDGVSRSRYVGGPIVLALGEDDAGQGVTLAPLALHAAGGTGRVMLRVLGVGASLAPGDVTISGLPGATLDSTGLLDVTVPEGHYVIRLSGPAALEAPANAIEVVANANLVFDAGTAYFVAPEAATRSALACTGAADCACLDGSCTGTCGAGVCASGFSPPALVPATIPYCPDPGLDFCATGTCASAAADPPLYCTPTAVGTCLPCGATCTPDGESTTGPSSGECGLP